jgi:hypothetical protein
LNRNDNFFENKEYDELSVRTNDVFFLAFVKANVGVYVLTLEIREDALFLFVSINKTKRLELKMLID